ncbi:MAG TPA: DUF732 domain-containing protein [Mycobacterium sp.]|nr:DUF732 domain-containing protein [Mycobacterium sp.]
MEKRLSAIGLMVASIFSGAMLNTTALAHADPITFDPDWANHSEQTKHMICDALAQGWSRAQIVDAAKEANDSSQTTLSVDDAGLRADAMIDAAHYALCPKVNLN